MRDPLAYRFVERDLKLGSKYLKIYVIVYSIEVFLTALLKRDLLCPAARTETSVSLQKVKGNALRLGQFNFTA
jgi:hypothetical protein